MFGSARKRLFKSLLLNFFFGYRSVFPWYSPASHRPDAYADVSRESAGVASNNQHHEHRVFPDRHRWRFLPPAPCPTARGRPRRPLSRYRSVADSTSSPTRSTLSAADSLAASIRSAVVSTASSIFSPARSAGPSPSQALMDAANRTALVIRINEFFVIIEHLLSHGRR
jgi:hypothetical protein